MPARRILSLWFPRLAAERALRRMRALPPGPLAVVAEAGGAQILAALTAEAEAAGLRRGQPLRDAMAICPALLTRPADPPGEAAFLAGLARWAGRFSPWVAPDPPDALTLDITGCAHLFGGEAALIAAAQADCADLGLSLRAGLADTRGAAWALAPLPLAALRLDDDTVAALARLGLRRVEDILGMPRAPLARRFGQGLVARLDQALGAVPEPVSPARPAPRFAVRLSLPDPIGLHDDILAGIDRLLPPLCDRLRAAGQGARRLRLQVFRCDHAVQQVEIGLARAADSPDRIRPLLALKLSGLDAGPGIDRLRIEAHVTEPLSPHQHAGHAQAARAAQDRQAGETALSDLIGRIGARIGPEAVTRRAPADSHIPEKGHQVLAAAWSDPVMDWPVRDRPRPLILFAPEPVIAPDRPAPPAQFRWRRQDFATRSATGPERIAPEWWLDDPAWRSGPRDYWRVETTAGARLWLYYAHGGALSSGWFCQGQFG